MDYYLLFISTPNAVSHHYPALKSGSIWQEVELNMYNDVIEMGVDKKEVIGNLSAIYCAIEVPCHIFLSFVKFNL